MRQRCERVRTGTLASAICQKMFPLERRLRETERNFANSDKPLVAVAVPSHLAGGISPASGNMSTLISLRRYFCTLPLAVSG